ncbi:hypothetical protein ABZ816_23365 [Actinosynnema sp. NPDC047251]|uniref:hypothetical protein n=1 Tax=Saccharothrix espanaensis TaxID=103731 RepID=UPI0011DC9BF3|nr:hypothetical protein [Saccharothrix espanaensis]
MAGPAMAMVCMGLLWLAGVGLFVLACRWSAAEPRRAREARRIATWLRAAPWMSAVGALVLVAGAGLLLLVP